MQVDHYLDIAPLPERAGGLIVRRITSSATADASMDICEIAVGASSALHEHSWEHQVFVVAGQGAVTDGQNPLRFRPGDVVVIPAGQSHQFVNVGDSNVLFICVRSAAALTSSPHDLTASAGGDASAVTKGT